MSLTGESASLVCLLMLLTVYDEEGCVTGMFGSLTLIACDFGEEFCGGLGVVVLGGYGVEGHSKVCEIVLPDGAVSLDGACSL